MAASSMIDRYRVAVVGLGRIGWLADQDERRPRPRSHISAWNSAPRAELVAACDSDTQLAGQASIDLNLPVFGDVHSMLEKVVPDIVSVAVPPAAHREVVEACAAVRVPLVVSEKPLAPNVKDAEAMVEACRASGTILLVNHFRRFDPHIRQEAARLGQTVGDPRTAVGWYSGGLLDGGTHMIDLLRLLLGEVTAIQGEGDNALLRFASGTRAALLAHVLAEHVVFDLIVTGSQGRLSILRGGLEIRWERAAGGYPLASGHRHLVPNGRWIDRNPRSFFPAMTAHAVAVLDGREAPVSTGEDGLAALKVIEAIEA